MRTNDSCAGISTGTGTGPRANALPILANNCGSGRNNSHRLDVIEMVWPICAAETKGEKKMNYESQLLVFLGLVISVIVVIVLIGYAIARNRKTYTPMTTIMRANEIEKEEKAKATHEPEKEEAPMQKKATIKYYRDVAGKWRWKLVASNGRNLCCPGESFASKRNARDNVRRIAGFFYLYEHPESNADS